MNQTLDREAESLRIGHLTYYVLKLIEGLHSVGMSPYYALLAQELESKTRLGAGKSLLFSRLKSLTSHGFLKVELGRSSNPKAKKPVRFYSLTAEGEQLLRSLEKERERIAESLTVYG